MVGLALHHLEYVDGVEQDLFLSWLWWDLFHISESPIDFSTQVVKIHSDLDPCSIIESSGLFHNDGGRGESLHLDEASHILLQLFEFVWIHSTPSVAGKAVFPELMIFLSEVEFEEGQEQILEWLPKAETVKGRP